jgi:MYXO-CTERM domain-containing protein
MRFKSIGLAVCLAASGSSAQAQDQPLTWSLAGGSESWPAWARDAITTSMNEAVAVYNRYGVFQKHVTATYNPGVPTAQANYDGWIEFGGQYNTRTALHEIAHALGTGTYRPLNGGPWPEDSAAGRLEKVYDGRAAVLSTGGTHFWPYGLNYDNEDGPAARERHARLVAALRFDMGIVADSDRDGLPDDWESFYFRGLAQAAPDDPDADGISNLDEYTTDSDPTLACPVRDGQSYVVRVQISGRVLTLESGKVVLRAAADLPGQLWTAHYAGAGYWRFASTDGDKVLEVPGSDTGSGRPLQVAAQSSTWQQQWRVTGGPGADPRHWQLANRETGRVADGQDGAEGAAVQQWPLLGDLPQQYFAFGGDAPTAADAGARGDAGARPSLDAGIEVAPDAGRGDAASARDAAPSRAPDAASQRDAGAELDAAGEPSPGEVDERNSGCSIEPLGETRDPSAFALVALCLAWTRRRRQDGATRAQK